MSWVGKQSRWMKMYRRRRYAVSCRQLNCEPTKEASWRLANDWWRRKQAEIDRAAPQHPFQPLIEELKQKEAWARQHGLADEAEKLHTRLTEIEKIDVADLDPASLPAGEPVDHAASRDNMALAATFGIVIPPDLDPMVSDYFFGDRRIWQERFSTRNTVPQKQTIAFHFGQWFEGQRAKVGAREIGPDRADANRVMLTHFVSFLGESSSVECVNESAWRNFAMFCRGKVGEQVWSSDYANGIMRVSRSFVRSLWESGLIDLPKNLTSHALSIKVKAKKKVFFEPGELKRQIESASTISQLQLHLLLMANCGFYQSDIAELKQIEVDWNLGIITRKRSKTDDREETPTVRWKLWPVTLDVLKKHRSGHPELVLLTNRGKPWVEKFLRQGDGKMSKTDKIASNYRRLVEKTGIKKPMKSIRKTSANLLESNKDHARFAGYFLGHAAASIKDRHYTDVSDHLFFAALDWLREQYGF